MHTLCAQVALTYHAQELSYAGIDLQALLKSGKKVRDTHTHTHIVCVMKVGACM